jgi:hypothetical protein
MYNKLKASEGFIFLSVTFESQQTINRIRDKYHITYPIYSVDEKECLRLNFDNGYPTNIILDKNSIVRHIYVGGEESKDTAKKFVNEEIYKMTLKLQ